MNNYESLLRENNIKVTPQRLSIVEELYGHIHMSIEELYKEIKKKFPTVSLATVYKNINAMMEKDFILEVKIPSQKSKYELAKTSHSHVVCRKCGKIEDIRLNLGDITQEASNLTHYQIDEDALVLSGLCPKCKAV
ncbi:MAG: transcriptional repressor [Campylobacterota bacterium]|nr:transcriptional repressor [Campylobacterota bacterium]